FLGVLSALQGGQGAETKDRETVQKATEKKVAPKAAADATAAAAQAFEKVSKELYPKAKQEGNLIIYSVWDVEHLRAITDAFMKKYPGIKATYWQDRKSTRLNSSHGSISYAVFCLKKKNKCSAAKNRNF